MVAALSPNDASAAPDLRAIAPDLAEGDVLDGRFELRETIGEGGMGKVYAAWDKEEKRAVAVKIMHATADGDARRFAREAAALATVDHPAIVRHLAQGFHHESPYLVMDRLVGTTLADRIAAGPLTLADTAAVGQRLAEGLAAVHRAGLAHRDVKPSNVFLVEGSPQAARLLDFGLARPHAGTSLTATGMLVGTPGYMAPEQVRGEKSIDPRADVFALGCVLFECLTGEPAFSADTTQALLVKILLEPQRPLRQARPDVPIALEVLIEQMLEKDVTVRPHAGEVARELAALAFALPTERNENVPNAPSPRLTEGTILAGKYRIERRIGEGGMGIVVAARHLELGKRVALKMLRRVGADDSRFLREAQAAARLESEHVARVLDVGRMDDGAPYIVMEHLHGVDLARRLVEGGPLDVETAVGYVLEACEAIAEAHALGIVHRDIKPSNLFLVSRRDGSELVKVLDFGISKVTRPLDDGVHGVHASADGARGAIDPSFAAVSLTSATSVMGSAAYMSPEQLHNAKAVDARTDIWAIGIALYELLTCARPFEGDTPAAIGARIAVAPPAKLRDVAKGAPAALEAVILRCLEKRPEDRFPTVAALASALAPFASEARQPLVDRIARSGIGRSEPGVERAPHRLPRSGSSPFARHEHASAWSALSSTRILVTGLGVAAAVAVAVTGALAASGRLATPSPSPAEEREAAQSANMPAPRAALPGVAIVSPSAVAPAQSAVRPLAPPAASEPNGLPVRAPAPAPRARPKPATALVAETKGSGPPPSAKAAAHDLDLSDPALQAR